MPVSIALLDELYAGHASIAPGHVARQIFIAQLLPLGLGIAFRNAWPTAAARFAPTLSRLGTIMLIALVIISLVDVWRPVVDAGPRIVVTIVTVTVLALAVGHLLGGPDQSTRTAVAISSAARNPGLALLVATLNAAPPEITATVLAYLVVSALTVLPYVLWRHRTRQVTAVSEP